MRKITSVLWAFAFGICLLQAQSRSPIYGVQRTTNIAADYQVTQQIGTLNNTTINTSSLKGIQSYPLDFDSVPYLRDTTLNYYEIGLIPEQTVQAGSLLHFYVKCDSLPGSNKTYSILPNGNPQGPLWFKASQQYFHFEPEVTDTISFTVFFTATNGSDTISQEVLFSVYYRPSIDNYAFGVGIGQTLPDPVNKEYQLETIINNYQPELFNGINRPTRSIAISAVDLYFENTAGNPLWSYSGNQDIKRLDIYAERLFIRDELKLPQTEVNIYCNQLIFENVPGRPEAAINTTPDDIVAALPGTPGIKGTSAGNINVFAGQMIDNDGGLRFRLFGGGGQSAVNAKAGDGGDGGMMFSNLDLRYKGDYLGGIAGVAAGTGTLADHHKGQPGGFAMDSIRTRWLHPNYIRQILAYSDDAYYLGFGQQVLQKLIYYDKLITDFTNSDEFNALDPYTASDLLQVNMEVIAFSNRILSGLDYFGNPPGWVPMLSFEFTKAAFESELENAMQILYLNYFITTAADTLQRRIDGYGSLKNQLEAQAATDESNFNNLVLVAFPDVENRINENKQRLEDLQQRINQAAADLERRANAAIDASKKSEWTKWAKLAGTVAMMIPIPVVQVIGAVVVAGVSAYESFENADNSKSNFEKIVDAGKVGFATYTEASKGFKATQEKWVQIDQQWQNFFPVFQGGVNIQSIKDQGKKGGELFTSLNSVVGDVQKTYDKLFNTPDPALKKIRSDLMTKDPVLAALNNEFKQASENHKKLIDEFNSTNEKIEGLASEIVGSGIAFDNASSNYSNSIKVLDHRTAHYIQYLRANALRRLKKYQYYMAKAYEFRTLQPFTGNLNLEPILTSIENMAMAASNSALTPAQYQTLAALFEDQISQVAEDIYDYYVSNAPAQTITTTYILPKRDIESLNKGETITFNPVQRGLFGDNEENVRIIDIKIHTLKHSIGSGTLGSPARIDVRFEYPNESYIKSKGKIYYFNNYNLDTENPINWSSRFDIATQAITAFLPSPQTSSLLQSLLIDRGINSSPENQRMYSQPSAAAELLVSRTTQNNNGTAQLYIDSVVIQVEYDFNNKPANISYLEVLTEPSWIVPQYIISKADRNLMQDGQGEMVRAYTTSASNHVVVSTEPVIGGYRFEKWTDQYGVTVTTPDSITPVKDFSMGQSRFYKVQYKWAGPILSVPDTLFLQNSQLSALLKVKNLGEADMEWIVDTISASWINIAGNVQNGWNDSTLTVNITVSPGDTLKLGYIVFIAPLAENAIDTVWIQYTKDASAEVTISGGILSEMNTPVRTVTLNLAGSGNQTMTTVNDGLYSFGTAPGGDYTVTPSKNNDFTTNNGVTTADILQIRRHILGTQALGSPYKIIAADVNASSTVTTQDILLLRTVILAVNPTFPNGKLWSFVPSNYVFANPQNPLPYVNFRTYNNISTNQINQNFIGIKLGDVNNTWDPNTPKMSSVGEVEFIMDEHRAKTGEEIIIPVKVKDFSDIAGYQFTLSWDPNVLSFEEVKNNSLQGYYGEQLVSEGLLTATWYSETGYAIELSDESVVFELKFRVIGENGSYSPIKIGSEITQSESYNDNLELLSIVSTNGIVKVGDADGLQQNGYTLAVSPNPFNNETNIFFSIPKDETVSIAIYDLLGKEVIHVKADYKAGEHKIEWIGDNEKGKLMESGLYLLRMTSGEYKTEAKVMLIR